MVATGLDSLIHGDVQRPRGRLGLITHGAGLTREGVPAHVALLSSGISIKRLMSPEHGLYGVAQDMEAVENWKDPLTDMEVWSLYGSSEDSLAPSTELLEDLDVVLWDLQDIGTRYYTYVWTALLVLEKLHDMGRQLWILDRPNPLGGVRLEGNMGNIRSFVGLHPVLVRHGLTAGELISLAASERGLSDALKVIRARGWSREQEFESTGLVWVPPSPNMPTMDTARVYPGMCLFEATTLSEGRGTTTPFLVFGAPYIEPVVLAKQLGDVPGVTLVPTYFRPMFQKHAGEVCGGLRLVLKDAALFDSWTFALNAISAVRRLWPDRFSWRPEAYEFVKDVPAMDLLTGSPVFRKRIEAGDTFSPDEFLEDARLWQERREPYLLYE